MLELVRDALKPNAPALTKRLARAVVNVMLREAPPAPPLHLADATDAFEALGEVVASEPGALVHKEPRS